MNHNLYYIPFVKKQPATARHMFITWRKGRPVNLINILDSIGVPNKLIFFIIINSMMLRVIPMKYIRSISSNRGKPNLKNNIRKIELGALPDDVVISDTAKIVIKCKVGHFFKNRKELQNRKQRDNWG